MSRKRRVLLSKFAVITAAVPVVLYAYSTGPPTGKSAAPGEGIRRDRHSGGSGGGSVEIRFPVAMRYTPGVKQPLTVTVTDAVATWYGFELSAPVAADNSQTGTLAPAPAESRLQVICSNDAPRPANGCPESASIEYLQHSPARPSNTSQIESTPSTADRGPVKVYIAANAAHGNGDPTGDSIYTASYTLTPRAGLPANQPKFTSSGVVNAATMAAGMSPGSFVTIFGENLAPLTRWWDGAIQGTALPSQLEGVSVTVGGKAAYLAYLSSSQLNVLLPTDEMTGSVEVKVTTPQGSASAAGVMERYAPGFFMSSLDRKYVAATHADNVLVAQAGQAPGLTSRPAQPGEEIVLWGTGFGPTAEPAPSGQVITRAYPLAQPGDLRVLFGGRDARVTFAGVTLAGVYQINVVTPPELADGDHMVQAEIAGRRTQDHVFLPVQGAAATGIRISYRLDPWLVSNNYQGELWVSPPVLGPVTQGGNTFALEVRAEGVDAQGQLTELSALWIPTDPGMVGISPGEGNRVRINVQHAGQSNLAVIFQGVSKDLAIKAAYQGGALLVEIAQSP